MMILTHVASAVVGIIVGAVGVVWLLRWAVVDNEQDGGIER